MASDKEVSHVLPAATSKRWQPIRSGLLNLYRFDYEEFRFEQGRLLLRGNNGTGKSRVLALQLPFLLDGEVAPHRLEPGGEPEKRIEWNLLMDKHTDRLGYTWIEFGRRGDDGQESYLTLGCGLRAVEGRGLAGKWFFVTKQRIGMDLFLQTSSGHALTRERLIEAVDNAGEVFTSAAAYRQAVDQALFKLGENRYSALVDLLIELRKPQLARKLDEQKLSAALSGALPHVSPGILADVAESFRSLQSDHDALDAFHAAGQAVEGFLKEYSRYCQIAARRRAEDVRKRHSGYEATMRRLRAAEGEQATAQEQLDQIGKELTRLSLAEAAARGAVDTLEQSPAMRSARELDAARILARERVEGAERAKREWERAVERHTESVRQRDIETEKAAAAWITVQAAVQKSSSFAAAIGLAEENHEAVERLGMPERLDLAAVSTVEQALAEAAQRRQLASRRVRELNLHVRESETALSHAKSAHAETSARVDDAQESHRQAHAELQRATAGLSERYRNWAGTLTELAPAAVEEIAPAVADWCQSCEGPSPVARAVQIAVSRATNHLAALQADSRTRVEAANAQRQELREAYDRLAAGRHEPPPPPHTREESIRAGRPGAPLWLLCDFAPNVPEETQVGIEAALEAAGLLDAWVTPDGRLLGTTLHDTVLTAGSSPLPPEQEHLGIIMAPAIDREDPQTATVSDDVVRDILRHIGLGSKAGWIWVDAEGRWQIGPLHGAWTKASAQHIGQAAREAERRRRMKSLQGEMGELERALEELKAEIERLRHRSDLAQEESSHAPDDGDVRRAWADVEVRQKFLGEQRARLSEAEAMVARRRQELSAAIQRRDEDARDLGVAEWINRLQDLDDGISEYLQSLAGLWPEVRALAAAREHAAIAMRREADFDSESADRAGLFSNAEKRAAEDASRRDTLEAAVGATAKDVMARLEEARRHQESVLDETRGATRKREDARVRLAVAEKDIQTQTEQIAQDTRQRDVAIQALKKFAVARLLSIAVAGLDREEPVTWSVTRAVEVARQIEESLENIASDDAAWDRNQKGIYKHIQELTQSLLHHNYHPVSTMEDDIFVVSVPFQGRDCTMVELRDALTEEVMQRQSLLNAREREILENNLVGEVAMHLHDRLRAAEELVREMNEELKARPMSTGMMLRFTWDPVADGPPGLTEARKRLLAAGGTWSAQDREALGGFLQQQIQAVRAANTTGTWQEHLATALDYRGWHQFGVERQQDGQWKRLTRRTHGTGSGGEKAVALTIPQFAAAAAHYRTADVLAPRLILLDEAFAGVDSDMRSKCMDLLRTFELDVVMTSENEWGCYPTVPGLAIYQLASRPGFEAIGVTRWVWNGRELLRQEAALPAAAPREKTAAESGTADSHGGQARLFS